MRGSLRTFVAIPAVTAVAFTIALGGLTPAQTPPPAKTQIPPAKGKVALPRAGRLDLNKATAEQMVEILPGVGAATARKIVAGRPYTSVDDLARAGVPARTIDAIRPLVEVAADAPKAAPTGTPTTPTRPATRPAGTLSAPAAATGRVNLNTATLEQLQELPGIGPVAARAIVAGRPFKSVDDLERVRGLGAAKVAALRDRVTVATATATTTTTTPTSTPPATTAVDPVATKKPAMTKGTIPRTTTTTTTAPATPSLGGLKPGQIVNINKAPKEQLDLLPGIGPVKAQAIIESRPFKTKEDVMKVKGIKEGEFARIKDLISVD